MTTEEPNPATRLSTVVQVAERLQVHKHDVYRFIKKGELKALKLSQKRIRVSEEELARFIRSREDYL